MESQEIDELFRKYEMGEATQEEKTKLLQLIEEENKLLSLLFNELQVQVLKEQLTQNQ